jgi:DNA-binding MarR family transcriptional regulator
MYSHVELGGYIINVQNMNTQPKTTELTILNYLHEHSDATQRELSDHVGISLGSINLLLKKMIQKGLIKIEKLQPNSIKYFLTPAGIASKLERTYHYISRTYNEIQLVRRSIVLVADAVAKKHNLETVYFFGEQDAIYRLIKDLESMEAFSTTIQCHNEIEEITSEEILGPVMIWSQEYEELMKSKDFKTVNIMKALVL